VPMPRLALGDHLSGCHIQDREQGGGPWRMVSCVTPSPQPRSIGKRGWIRSTAWMLRFRSRHVSRRCQVLSHVAQSGHLGGHCMPKRTESIAFLPTGPWGSAPFGRSSRTGSQLGCSIEADWQLGSWRAGPWELELWLPDRHRSAVLPIRFTRLGGMGASWRR
jgi:hypothetical protein